MNLPPWIIDPNSNRINFHEPFEIQYWVQEWKIKEYQLREARVNTGSSIVIEVYRQLKLSGLIKRDDPTIDNSFTGKSELQSV